MISGIGQAYANAMLALLLAGILIGISVVALGWALWYFVFSHLNLSWI